MAGDDQFDAVASRWEAAGLGPSAGFLALGAVLRAHAVITSAVDGILRSWQLSRNGYLVLVTLYLADRGTRSHGRLARDLLVHPTTITLVTDQLVRDGLVRRAPDPADRRATLSTITARGRRLVVSATEELTGASFGFGGAAPLAGVLDALRTVSSGSRSVVPNHRARAGRPKRAAGGGN
jgi:DNA-binding MarR family transcriptional regulator